MTKGTLSELHDDQHFLQLRGGVRNAGKRSGSLRDWHREWQRVLFPSPAISQPRYTAASLCFPRFQSLAVEWRAGSWNCSVFFPLPVTEKKREEGRWTLNFLITIMWESAIFRFTWRSYLWEWPLGLWKTRNIPGSHCNVAVLWEIV